MANDYSTTSFQCSEELALECFFFDISHISSNDFGGCEVRLSSNRLLELLSDLSMDAIFALIKNHKDLIGEINSQNIPQFSNVFDVDKIISIVQTNPNSTFEDLGYYFNKSASVVAQRKYGENHYKTAALMGLTTWNKPFEVTPLGYCFDYLSKEQKDIIRPKLFFRIPVIQKMFIQAEHEIVFAKDVIKDGNLSDTTVTRRTSNVKKVASMMYDTLSNGNVIRENIKWEYKD